MGSVHSFADFLDLVRRRFWVIAIIAVLGCLFSFVYALRQTHQYQSVAVIQATQPKISGAGLATSGSAARRLQLVEQRLMARDNVVALMDRFDLYPEMRVLPEAERVAQMRQSVRIEAIAAAGVRAGETGSVSVITVTATLPTARQAQLVASELTHATIDLITAARIEQADETLKFFTSREDAIREELAQLEDARADFRSAHDLSMRGEVEFMRSELGTLNDGLLDIARERVEIERAIDLAQQDQRKATRERKISDLNEDLATLEAQRNLMQVRKAELEAELDTTPEVDRQLAAFEREVVQLREDLDEATDQRARAEIAYRLEKRAQSEQLVILEPASLPEYPISGSRKKIAMMGAFLSLGFGLFVAFLLDLRKPVLRNAAQMEREIGFRPVVTIPVVDSTPKPRRFWPRRTN
jgi:uncharacterized protein involved in exopolysaccharide biosynthesis